MVRGTDADRALALELWTQVAEMRARRCKVGREGGQTTKKKQGQAGRKAGGEEWWSRG